MMSNKFETEKKKNGGESDRLMDETEVHSKSYYMDKTPPRPPFSSSSRSNSLSQAQPVELRRLLKHPSYEEQPKRKLKKYILGWKALKAFSTDKSRKFTCCFSLQVHSIENLSIFFKELSLCVHLKRRDETKVTRPAKVIDGAAKFEEEKLSVTCSVYGTKSGHSVKYEVKNCQLYATVSGAPGLDLGKHEVDLAQFLPLTWEELEEEKSSGERTTSFKLSGKARGAVMNVTFGYTVLSDAKKNRKTSAKFGNDDQKSTMRAVESVPCLANTPSLDRLMEEMKEHRDIFPSSKSDTDDANLLDQKFDEYMSDESSVVDQNFDEHKPDDANMVDQKFEEHKPDDVKVVDQKFDEHKPDDVKVVDQKYEHKPDDANVVDQKFDEHKPNDVNVVDQKFDEHKPDDASVASEPEPELNLLIEHFEPTLAHFVASDPIEYIVKEPEEDEFSVVDKGKELSSQEHVMLEEGPMVVVVPKVESNQVFEIKTDTGGCIKSRASLEFGGICFIFIVSFVIVVCIYQFP